MKVRERGGGEREGEEAIGVGREFQEVHLELNFIDSSRIASICILAIVVALSKVV